MMSVFSLPWKLMIELGVRMLLSYGWILYVISPPKSEAKAAIVDNYQKRETL